MTKMNGNHYVPHLERRLDELIEYWRPQWLVAIDEFLRPGVK